MSHAPMDAGLTRCTVRQNSRAKASLPSHHAHPGMKACSYGPCMLSRGDLSVEHLFIARGVHWQTHRIVELQISALSPKDAKAKAELTGLRWVVVSAIDHKPDSDPSNTTEGRVPSDQRAVQ